MESNDTLYSRAVRISEEYLGPAGERFMRRQITTHLDIEPEQLHQKHLLELVEWIRLASAVLTNNSQLVNDFSNQILKLGSKEKPKVPARKL